MVKSSFRRISVAVIGVLVSVTSIWGQAPPGSRIDLASPDLGRTWVPTVLIPWATYGADFGGVSGWNVEGISAEQRHKDLDGWFSRLQHDGVRVIAWFLFGD